MRIVKEIVPYIVIVILVFLIRTFIFTPIVVQGESMVPTLSGGELMILKKYDKSYQRFDIVVVSKEIKGDNLIKRIIGLPGETIRYKNNHLYIDDKIVDDKYAYGDTDNFQEIKLGKDEYFLMGDNRKISLDSRILGPIKTNNIEGKVGILLFPFNRIGYVK